MSEDKLSDIIPIQETSDDRIERELRNNFNVLMGIDRRLDEIANAVGANTANIEILEEAVSLVADIPTRPSSFNYDHRTNQLIVNGRPFIAFKGKEADVFSLMFYRKDGLPKKTKLYCSEVAAKLQDHAAEKKLTSSTIYQTVKRVKSKLDARINTKNLLVVKTKEFYFSPK